jgi:hypothetical protein
MMSALEPFDHGLFSHGSPSAYPPDRSHAIFPSSLGVWSDPSLDEMMAHVLRDGARTIRSVALGMGRTCRMRQDTRITPFSVLRWRRCMAEMCQGSAKSGPRSIQKESWASQAGLNSSIVLKSMMDHHLVILAVLFAHRPTTTVGAFRLKSCMINCCSLCS